MEEKGVALSLVPKVEYPILRGQIRLPQPQQYHGQRLSRGRGIFRNALWLCPICSKYFLIENSSSYQPPIAANSLSCVFHLRKQGLWPLFIQQVSNKRLQDIAIQQILLNSSKNLPLIFLSSLLPSQHIFRIH